MREYPAAPVYPPAYTPTVGGYAPSSDPAPRPSPAIAPELPGPGARVHEGFFFRASAGLGVGGSRYDEPLRGEDLQVDTRGIARLFDFSLGGSLTENWILHGQLALSRLSDERREVDGERRASEDSLASALLVAGGVTYYFMPVNVYLTGTLGVAKLSETRGDYTAVESRAGLGTTLSVGKEWWVGAPGEWGIGVALRASFYTAKADVLDTPDRIYLADLGLLFSATLN